MLPAFVTCALLLARPAAAAAPVQDPPAQSMNDLRQEIDRLNAEIARRDEELAKAKDRIKELETAIAALRSVPAGTAKSAPAGAPPAPPAPGPAPEPADPSFGPGGLLAKLQSDYLVSYPELPALSTDQQRAQHFRSLERWSKGAERTPVGRVSWTGRIDAATMQVGAREATFTAEFASGGRTYRVPMTVDRVVLDRALPSGGVPAGPLSFTGEPSVRLSVNPDRPSPGAFDFPAMVGPYVECTIAFAVKAMAPPTAEAP
jgi:hypothetical protein